MNRQKRNELEKLIEMALPGWEIPGVAIGVVKDDEPVFAKGFGECETGTGHPANEHTVFAIGSNTKAFTVAALGLLVQEGKLSWDDPVLQYLPHFQLHDPRITRAIKVRDLLCHRSGLPTWGGDLLSYGSNYNQAEILRRVRHIPQTLQFRSDYGYSNLMFLAAGQIIPAITQTPWDAFIKRRIFEPLSMKRSSTSVLELANMNNVASPHEKVGGVIQALPYRNLDMHNPAGAINSTVTDMLQWLRMQLNNGKVDGKQLLETAVIAETRIPHTLIPNPPAMQALIPATHFTTYGLGWRLRDYYGRLIVSHGGGVDGMLSLTGMLPEINLGIVILTNKLPHNFARAVFHHIVDAYLDAPPRDWNKAWHQYSQKLDDQKNEKKKKFENARVRGTQSTLNLFDYAGTYTSSIYGQAHIALENGKLTIRLSAHPDVSGALEHWHYDTFLCRWTDPVFNQSILPFTINRLGKVEQFKLSVRPDWIDPLEYVFVKDAQQTPNDTAAQ